MKNRKVRTTNGFNKCCSGTLCSWVRKRKKHWTSSLDCVVILWVT